MFHSFQHDIEGIELPKQFTYPFSYEPHPLSRLAADEVLLYLSNQIQWHEELSQGKMFGVLVVRDSSDKIGFLAAFSGQLDGTYLHDYFVPPVYDLSAPGGFFREEEKNISEINKAVEAIQNDGTYRSLIYSFIRQQSLCEELVESWKRKLEEAKRKRDEKRKENLTEEEKDALIRESQFLKAESKRQKKEAEAELEMLRSKLETYKSEIRRLKQERKIRSANLQNKLFDQFVFYDAKGEKASLCGIFQRATLPVPPSGAGECAAPKLLQYAYLNHYHPLCMAEFWWGESPKSIVRVHGHFYPACKSKCEPILNFMLSGLDVEPSPLLCSSKKELKIVWEDDYLLVVDKPHKMLSVQGKSDAVTVYSLVRDRYPDATGPMIVHRLDMSTSGLMIIAKSKEVHCALQKQFENHSIKKRYVALLEGIVSSDTGTIKLPLCPDVEHRPCQMVSDKYGKYAETYYEVIGRENGRTKVFFYPKTGRTHQLRLHAAHPLGLNAPIVGDMLYGTSADRLYLQAQRIDFEHPVTKERICVELPEEF